MMSLVRGRIADQGVSQMAKAKSKAIMEVADGAGGMTQVEDRRFETNGWLMRFTVPKQEASDWLHYLSAECGRRGWSSSCMTQLEAKENSGSISINTGCPGQQLAIVWERKRGGPIKVRARSAGTTDVPPDQINDFFQQINERSRNGATEEYH